MKKNPMIFLLGITIFLYSCESNQIIPLKKEVFGGYVQKGPFVNGTEINISELDKELNQTGRNYSTTVADNSGGFEQKKIELNTNFVQLKATGYYFNEVIGDLSSGTLTLYALSDVSTVNSANINVLTHLEKSRVEYLVQEKGLSFKEAKNQAQKEVLDIFSFEFPSDQTSESLDLSTGGADNAILLAVSCILQGPKSTAQLSELLGNIITDIKTDGKLNNASNGTQLIDNAIWINLPAIRKNLENKYAELGVNNVVIPDFEKYVNEFITKTNYNQTYKQDNSPSYPVSGKYGLNLLNDTVSHISLNSTYSIRTNVKDGSIDIIIKGEPGVFYIPDYYKDGNGWSCSTYDPQAKSQSIYSPQDNNDIKIDFADFTNNTTITIEYYYVFDRSYETPNRIRTIAVSSPPISTIFYKLKGRFGDNILNDTVNTIKLGSTYSMKATIPEGKSFKVMLKGEGWNVENNMSGLDYTLLSPHFIANMNWTIGSYESSTKSQEFIAKNGYSSNDLNVSFSKAGIVIAEYYVNGESTPSKIRQLNIE